MESTPESRREDREILKEHRQEAREIVSSREAEELKFKREEDYLNLKEIPLMAQTLRKIEKLLETSDVTGTKRDVEWLKQFFWILTGGIITELIAMVGIVMFKLGR